MDFGSPIFTLSSLNIAPRTLRCLSSPFVKAQWTRTTPSSLSKLPPRVTDLPPAPIAADPLGHPPSGRLLSLPTTKIFLHSRNSFEDSLETQVASSKLAHKPKVILSSHHNPLALLFGLPTLARTYELQPLDYIKPISRIHGAF